MTKLMYCSIIPNHSAGVFRKIKSQLNAFKELISGDVYHANIDLDDSRLSLTKNNNLVYEYKYRKNNFFPFFNRFRYTYLLYFILKDYVYNNKITHLYFRMHFMTSFLIIKLLKYQFKDLKIYLEVPSYPYMGELFLSFRTYLGILPDLFFWNIISSRDCKVVTSSNYRKIHGIETIRITNGFNECKPIGTDFKKTHNNNIVFTSVSTMAIWHGIDRFLKTLDHYKLPNLIFNVVGSGVQEPELRRIVSKSDYLSSIVRFCGNKRDSELFEIYSYTNICVGSLGLHRINVKEMSPLKNREYLATGLPIIYSTYDEPLESIEFALRIPDNEGLINLPAIIEWYKDLKANSTVITEYAQNNLSWKRQLLKLIDDFS